MVPKGRYVDPEFLALEHERLIPNMWQLACREEELPQAANLIAGRRHRQAAPPNASATGASGSFDLYPSRPMARGP